MYTIEYRVQNSEGLRHRQVTHNVLILDGDYRKGIIRWYTGPGVHENDAKPSIQSIAGISADIDDALEYCEAVKKAIYLAKAKHAKGE